jgi:type III restriction enzyme
VLDLTYDSSIVEGIATMLDLRTPNRVALGLIAEHLETLPMGEQLVASIATAVGKTYVAAGLVDYLYEQGVRNVVIVVPSTIILNKTRANFTPGHPKFVRGLQCRPVIVTLDDFENGRVAGALENPDAMKVFIFTVQSLLRPDTKENRRAHRPYEVLGQALTDYLRSDGDLVVIADEDHVYEGNAKKFFAAFADLAPRALVGLTATLDPQTPEKAVIYHYTLAQAIADGYVKIPIIVGCEREVKDTRAQLLDSVALLDAKRSALEAWCEATGTTFVQPVLLVVAQTIDEAEQIRDTLAEPDLLGDPAQVLLITSRESEEDIARLDLIERPDSKVRAVVSVSMLKEGWDVRNIYVITSTRELESKLLTEQILGRGLRLPFGKRTSVQMLDSVEVLSHHSFTRLLEQARSLIRQALGSRAEEAEATVRAAGDLAVSGPVPAGSPVATPVGTASMTFTLPGLGATSLFDDESTGGPSEVVGIATLDERLLQGGQAVEALATPERPQNVKGAKLPLFIPRIDTSFRRTPLSLDSINLTEVEALGQRFSEDNAKLLRRKAVTGKDIVDAEGAVEEAAVLRLPFATIEMDLVTRLVRSDAIAQTIEGDRFATAIAQSFLVGARAEEGAGWRPEHVSLASAALSEWVGEKLMSSKPQEVTTVTLMRYPDGDGLRPLTALPRNRNLVTGRPDFERRQPYSGWSKSLYPSARFDSWSAEFRLAELLDTAKEILLWLRVDEDVPLRISYRRGAAIHTYRPDFIAVDRDGFHWILEGKANDEMTDEVVLAKREGATEWVRKVNASTSVQATWGYVLASEDVVGSAGDWRALTAGAQVFR